MREAITLFISGLALAVAVYGIFERRAAVYAALRVRITELIGEIGQVNVEEGKEESTRDDDHAHSTEPEDPIEYVEGVGYLQTMASLNARRALLTYQALSLVNRLRPRLTSRHGDQLTASEHGMLADSLARLADVASATDHWIAAVTSNNGNSDFLRLSSHRGHAAMLTMTGDFDGARHQFAAALECCPNTTSGRVMAWNVLGGWIWMEMQAPGGDPAGPTRRAFDLAQQDERLKKTGLEALRKVTTKTEIVDGKEIRSCILDEVMQEQDLQ